MVASDRVSCTDASSHTDPRREPVGAVRSSGLAGEPRAGQRWFPRDRHLPSRCQAGLRTGNGDRGRAHPALSVASSNGWPVTYLREYTYALWHTLRLAIRVRREGPVDVVHACNPPDLLFLIALVLRLVGARFVFDHHDLVPELFVSRFPGRRPSLLQLDHVRRTTHLCGCRRSDLDERKLSAGRDRTRENGRRSGGCRPQRTRSKPFYPAAAR